MAVLHKTRNEVLPNTQLEKFPMRTRVFLGCKMAASTIYKHRVLSVTNLLPGNTHALIGKFCNYVLGTTSFGNGYMEIGLLISSLHGNLAKVIISTAYDYNIRIHIYLICQKTDKNQKLSRAEIPQIR